MMFIDHSQRQIADVLHLLVQEDSLPLLVHCAYGKDRTGIIVALVLSVLEVEEDKIIEDYHASEVFHNIGPFQFIMAHPH